MAADAWLFPARPAYLFNERGYVRAAWGNATTPNPPFGAVLTYHLRETLPEDQTLVVTISDEAGERIRQLELPNEMGMQRVAWDLRRDPPAEGAGPPQRRRPRRGALVAAGRYTATLGRLVGESVTTLGEPQTILVVAPQS